VTDHVNNLYKCDGCSLGSTHNDSCIIYFSSSSASSLWTSHANNSNTKFKLNNSLDELLSIQSTNNTTLQSINISQPSPPISLFDLVDQPNKMHVQIKGHSVIVNNIEVKLVNPGLLSGNLLQVIDNILQFSPNSTIIEIGSNQKIL